MLNIEEAFEELQNVIVSLSNKAENAEQHTIILSHLMYFAKLLAETMCEDDQKAYEWVIRIAEANHKIRMN